MYLFQKQAELPKNTLGVRVETKILANQWQTINEKRVETK